MLEVRDLTAGYGKREVLSGLSVSFERGAVTAILGPNGCGKSTLLKAVMGLIPRWTGTVLVDGEDTASMDRRGLALRLAYLSQGQDVPAMTVERLALHGRFPYLTYPDRYTEKDREAAQAAMMRVGIADLASNPLDHLSGGTRQAAYLAMALAREAPYILLDEPTTYLDVGHQTAFMKLLRELSAEGRGVVTVMHDLPLALYYADRVAVLANGSLQTFGTPREVVRDGVIPRVFGVDVVEEEGNFYCRFR